MKKIITLKNKMEFDRVYNKKISYANKYLIMYVLKSDLTYNRIGISISKKVGNSVTRNKIRRFIKESYRNNIDEIKSGYDIIVIARKGIDEKGYKEIESALFHLYKLHKLFVL